MHNYCKLWNLEVNLTKTKIIIMKSGGGANNNKVFYGENEIKQTNEYRYLGTIINSKGNFTLAQADLKNNVVKYFTGENTTTKNSHKTSSCYD